MCQCFWELAGSVVFYKFDLLGDVGLLHLDVYDWMDYDLVEVGVFSKVSGREVENLCLEFDLFLH